MSNKLGKSTVSIRNRPGFGWAKFWQSLLPKMFCYVQSERKHPICDDAASEWYAYSEISRMILRRRHGGTPADFGCLRNIVHWRTVDGDGMILDEQSFWPGMKNVSLEPKHPNFLRLNELYFSLNQFGRKMRHPSWCNKSSRYIWSAKIWGNFFVSRREEWIYQEGFCFLKKYLSCKEKGGGVKPPLSPLRTKVQTKKSLTISW